MNQAQAFDIRELNRNQDEEVLLAWQGPSRLYKPRSREFYQTAVSLVILLGIIFIFAGEFFLVFVLLALTFVTYVFSSIKPDIINYQITTHGVTTGGEFKSFEQMIGFWLEVKDNQGIVYIETPQLFPRLIVMITTPEALPEIKDLLSQVLDLVPPEKTVADKIGDWIKRKFPLES